MGAAVADVADAPRDSAEYRADLNRRLRAAYLSGVEEWSLVRRGRPLTAEELLAALPAYPGDLPSIPGKGDAHRLHPGEARQ